MENIAKQLNTAIIGKQIKHYDSVESTNKTAKEGAGTIFKEGAIVVSKQQTKGRGRLDRQWVSRKDAGLWMSVVLGPNLTPKQLMLIPLSMAIGVSQAIENAIGEKAKIKWPNDIVCQRRKVCGMLAEMTVVDNLQYIIYGIGINVNINQCDFPQEIQQTATSLSEVSGTKIDQEQLLIHVIQCLDQQYHKVLDNQSINIKKEYKEKCITLNQEIKVHTLNESYVAVARDIAEDGALIINREGEIQLVYAGDVSVRGIDGYI